jgi:oleandomycin transport system ATP-binding protein
VIGGQTLEVQPADPDRFEDVRAILAAVGTKAPESLRKGVLTVPVAGDAAMPQVVARLAAENIAVAELSLHFPSLDEVFFTLVGRTAVDTEEVAR